MIRSLNEFNTNKEGWGEGRKITISMQIRDIAALV